MRVTRPGGHIFVGDVRSLPLLEAYYTSVQLHKAPGAMPLTELCEGVRRARFQERELVVDPKLFEQAAVEWKRLGVCRLGSRRDHTTTS